MNFNCIKNDLNPMASTGITIFIESNYHEKVLHVLYKKLYYGLRGDLAEMLFDNIDIQLYLELTKNDPELKMYEAA